MREILFRGKRADNVEWVYGNLVEWLNETKDVSIIAHTFGCCIDEVGNLVLIEEPFVCKVHPETIGQYTGMTDRNGNKIFEGDIAKCRGGEYCYGVWEYCSEIIISNLTQIGFELGEYEHIEIIGNIHDKEEE